VVLFTRADILAGQGILLENGLMEYGSIFGHGAYLGPDFTAEYLHRAAHSSNDFYAAANPDTARARTIQDFKTNRYEPLAKFRQQGDLEAGTTHFRIGLRRPTPK